MRNPAGVQRPRRKRKRRRRSTRKRPTISSRPRYASARTRTTWRSSSARCATRIESIELVNNPHDVAEIADRGVGLDRQAVLDVGGDGVTARFRDEVDPSHSATLRAVDVDIEVVADEDHLAVVDAELPLERVEDRRARLALAMLVREDHRVD